MSNASAAAKKPNLVRLDQKIWGKPELEGERPEPEPEGERPELELEGERPEPESEEERPEPELEGSLPEPDGERPEGVLFRAGGDWIGGDRYAIVRLLGKGGMCEVWLAYDRAAAADDPGRYVAVKVLQSKLEIDETSRRRLKAEALAFMEIKGDPNLPRVYEADIDPERKLFYYVMEYLAQLAGIAEAAGFLGGARGRSGGGACGAGARDASGAGRGDAGGRGAFRDGAARERRGRGFEDAGRGDARSRAAANGPGGVEGSRWRWWGSGALAGGVGVRDRGGGGRDAVRCAVVEDRNGAQRRGRAHDDERRGDDDERDGGAFDERDDEHEGDAVDADLHDERADLGGAGSLGDAGCCAAEEGGAVACEADPTGRETERDRETGGLAPAHLHLPAL